MNTVSDKDSSLVTKCMEFTMQLANQGKGFNFSLSLPSGFSFSLDFSQEKTTSRIPEKKKKSPSTLRRNSQRRKTFLDKKVMEKQAEVQLVYSQPSSKNKKIKCDKCEATFQDSDLLKQHIAENHIETLICEECHHTTKSKKDMEDHQNKIHVIPQLDGITENKMDKQEQGDSTIKHDEIGPRNEIPSFTCPFCDTPFTSNINQHWHAVSCPKNFRGQESLRQGELMHQQALGGGFPPWYPR